MLRRLPAALTNCFSKLGNRYESALSLYFTRASPSSSFMNDPDARCRVSLAARELFVQEGNETLDRRRGFVACTITRFASNNLRRPDSLPAVPRRFSKGNMCRFAPQTQGSCRPRACRRLQETGSAIADAQRALQELEGFHAPWVSYQAFNTLGKLKEIEGGTARSGRHSIMRAITELELLRGNIRLDELRMSFGKDKYRFTRTSLTSSSQ